MVIFKGFGRKKRRKYPIKRDADGKTARKRCFEMFEDKVPLPEIAKTIDVKIDTVRTYYKQWKKNPDIERHLAYYNWILDKSAPDRERSKEIAASLFGMSKEQLETALQQPYGLRRLLSNKIYSPAHADAAHKRYIALELAMMISDHLLKHGGKFEDVYVALKHWMQESQESREEEDADIKEENWATAFTRQILEAAVREEQQGRVKLDRLSDEERNLILRYGIEARWKELEKSYWQRISTLIAEGLTMEQAREKIYQDLLEKGDLEGAKKMREYQDFVHPIRPGDQLPPPSPLQPPSPT